MKKEARVAHVEALPGGGLLAVIFRGGWVDGLSASAGPRRGSVAEWLEGFRHMEGIRGVSVGESLGAAEAAEVVGWARAKGLPEVKAGGRNLRQAKVIAEGFGGLLEGKS